MRDRRCSRPELRAHPAQSHGRLTSPIPALQLIQCERASSLPHTPYPTNEHEDSPSPLPVIVLPTLLLDNLLRYGCSVSYQVCTGQLTISSRKEDLDVSFNATRASLPLRSPSCREGASGSESLCTSAGRSPCCSTLMGCVDDEGRGARKAGKTKDLSRWRYEVLKACPSCEILAACCDLDIYAM